jgi:hypothetical protein
VKGLGNFIEIEYKGKRRIAKKDVEPLKQAMRTYLKKKHILIGTELDAGKPELLLQKKQKVVSSAKIKTGKDRKRS